MTYSSSIEIKKRSEHSWHTDPAAPFVGCFCVHKRYSYVCVVVGWDPVCKMSREWQKQMGVAELERGAHQPFHSVRAVDGSSRYAAFESLKVCCPSRVQMKQIQQKHPNISRYFTKFDAVRNAFGLNEPMKARYPDDGDLHAHAVHAGATAEGSD